MQLVMALSYSSRWEIIEADKKNCHGSYVRQTWIRKQYFPANIQKYLCTAGFPDPELMIRTSGEYRISNFLLIPDWPTLNYILAQVLWPDFRKENLYEAILDFQGRERRFGKTSDQLRQTNPARKLKIIVNELTKALSHPVF